MSAQNQTENNQDQQNQGNKKPKSQFHARLDNQKAQLERNGYSAEVVVRTTPEATDMINFARIWEHIIVTADRRTRGYMAKGTREDFEKTNQAFVDSIAFMMKKMEEEVARHDIDLTGNNFICRIAQRYKLAKRAPRKEKPKAAKPAKQEKEAAAPKEEPKAQEKKKASAKKPTQDQVDGL